MHMATVAKRQPFHLRHRRLYNTLFIVMLVAALSAMIWFMVNSTSFMLFGTIVTHVDTDEKVIALTLDDGPLPGTTEETLEVLKALNVKATFFVIGVEAKRHPEQLKKIVSAGHEVGNHSYSHKAMTLMSYDDVAKEVEDNDKLIRAAGYTGPIPFRVPYNIKFVTLPYYLMKHQRLDISRDVITNEGWKYTAQQIAANIEQQIRPGSILLLHPMYKHTASSRKAISLIVKDLRAQGYRFVTISQLLSYKKS